MNLFEWKVFLLNFVSCKWCEHLIEKSILHGVCHWLKLSIKLCTKRIKYVLTN
jgi:hypothetical protein